ncbi:glycosyltransferase [Sphingomonas sp. LM7]|uniref:glycosyltransferase n=1 Tax=Sphingomonas sp. LM7 TaxID=1938607 RepID=UPI000983F0E2|nr:glycosyltransferase [Sphingomonas sp. LM7]AQR75537.1 hypothetical protein BXU08_19415 [Sphingomonas sp. LM7]
MKITHIIPALTKGGAERVLIDLANEAAAAGHDVTVVLGAPVAPELGQAMLRPDVRIRFISQSFSKLARYGRLPVWLAGNWRWLREQDVVHCHLTLAAILGTGIGWLRRLSGSSRPVVVETFHGVGMPIKWRQLALTTALARGRDGFALMAQDSHWSRFAERNPALPIAIIPNGVAISGSVPDTAAVAAYRQQIGVPESARWIVGTIGRILPERNPLATVAAFAEAARLLGDDVHFLMGGSGSMLEEVRAAGDAAGLGARLHLPGLVVEPRFALALMDVYVSMNVGPITGIAGLEAAAAGVPVIAVQALADYRRAPGDWIWSDPDPTQVGAEAARLLRDGADRAATGQRQKAHVLAHHSAAHMMHAYEDLYARARAVID